MMQVGIVSARDKHMYIHIIGSRDLIVSIAMFAIVKQRERVGKVPVETFPTVGFMILS